MTDVRTSLTERIERLRDRALADLERADDEAALERWRLAYLGRKSELTELSRSLGAVPPAERPLVGQAVNRARLALETAHGQRAELLRARALERRLEAERVDVTLPGRRPGVGRLHPLTRTINECLRILATMGFQVYESPEVELDYYNFAILNIPPEHPARDLQDTFYVNPPEVLLRTQTTAYQGRVLREYRPPVRVAGPGRVYRFEQADATHGWMFHQIDGLAVDEGLTLADLKGTLQAFAQQIFWPDVRTRFRCDYFPFVEPGVDMAISCSCGGAGCAICKGSGWLEILGAGMVHPKVLAAVGLDPDRYQGFAWGMGPERITMLKYGIPDLRLFFANDLRFLEQFPA